MVCTSKYMSAIEYIDSNAGNGFGAATAIVQVLKQCDNDLSRENIMKQAANLKDFRAPLLYPGITIYTSPTNYSPIRQLQLQTFNGEGWEPIGDVMSIEGVTLLTAEAERGPPLKGGGARAAAHPSGIPALRMPS
jgi:hypothetical protein